MLLQIWQIPKWILRLGCCVRKRRLIFLFGILIIVAVCVSINIYTDLNISTSLFLKLSILNDKIIQARSVSAKPSQIISYAILDTKRPLSSPSEFDEAKNLYHPTSFKLIEEAQIKPPTPTSNQRATPTLANKTKILNQPVSSKLIDDVKKPSATPTLADKIKNQPVTSKLIDDVQMPSATSSLADRNKDTERLKNLAHSLKVKEISCSAVFQGSEKETKKAINLAARLKKQPNKFTEEFYLNATQNCQHFQKRRGYIMSPLTKEEESFPLAFSMLVFTSVDHVERLLRVIYRPQNCYCIHVDAKSPEKFYLAVKAIASCFPNVFLTNTRIDVRWGTFSILEPELMCMKLLWNYKKWKYFINLTGQEFPLKTNWQLVKILTAYKGANDVESTIERAPGRRWMNTLPPRGIRPIKGSVHVTVNRDFVDYILHNETAEALLNWTKITHIPDETFFTTLNHNPQLGIRGSYKGFPETDLITKPFLTRTKQWRQEGKTCPYQYIHKICILTVGDLARLGQEKHLFANKFHINHDKVVLGCLEEKLAHDTLNEYMGVQVFNTSFYENLNFVKNQVV